MGYQPLAVYSTQTRVSLQRGVFRTNELALPKLTRSHRCGICKQSGRCTLSDLPGKSGRDTQNTGWMMEPNIICQGKPCHLTFGWEVDGSL